MRILSEAEMDDVFGGQATDAVTTTLPDVVVTGQRMTFSGGGYWLMGADFSRFNHYDENSGSSGACYLCSDGSYLCGPHQFEQPALPSVPTPEKLMCIMDAAAVPGNDLLPNFRFAVVNSYANYDRASDTLHLSSSPFTTTGYTRGLTIPTLGSGSPYSGSTSIYADAMDGDTNPTTGAYYDANGTLVSSYYHGTLSAIEEAVLVTAHEARHQHVYMNPGLLGTRDEESDARTFGIKALENFRAGQGASCN